MSDTEIHFTQFEEDNFVSIPNATIRNRELSWGAKGLLAYLLSHTKDWKIKTSQLYNFYQGECAKGNGQDSVKSFIKELRKFKYMVYKKTRDKNGRWVHLYYLFKKPCTDEQFKIIFPEVVKPPLVKPPLVKPPITENHVSEDYLIEKQHQPQAPLKENVVGVVFFDSIKEKTDLSDSEKHSLMKYPQDRVDKAIKYCYHSSFKVKTTRIQSLHWHCNLEIPLEYSEESCDNEKLWQYLKTKYDGKKIGWADIVIGSEYAEFGSGNSAYRFEKKDPKLKEKLDKVFLTLKT